MNDSNKYIKVDTLSKFIGVSVRRVQQLTQEGVFDTVEVTNPDGKKGRMYEFLPNIKKYITYLSGKSSKEIELRQQKMAAEINLKESQGELHRIKTEIAAGEYISIAEVKVDYSEFFITFKKFAMSIPGRVGGLLSGYMDPSDARKMERELSKEISDMLTSFVVAGIVEPRTVKECSEKKAKSLEETV